METKWTKITSCFYCVRKYSIRARQYFQHNQTVIPITHSCCFLFKLNQYTELERAFSMQLCKCVYVANGSEHSSRVRVASSFDSQTHTNTHTPNKCKRFQIFVHWTAQCSGDVCVDSLLVHPSRIQILISAITKHQNAETNKHWEKKCKIMTFVNTFM